MISRATIDRLPFYFRTLRVAQNEGVEIISSDELGKRIGVTPEQIRKDLAAFGEFGKKGVGYYVSELMRNIGEILGLHKKWNIAIAGLGHLGWALANYRNFNSLGFKVTAIFDTDPAKVSQDIHGLKIYHFDKLSEIVEKENIQIGVITLPADYAQIVAERMIAAGIYGIWNFAPVKLRVPKHTCIIFPNISA